MINILHVINGWPSGGITEQTYLLCKHLPKDQFKQYSIGYCHFNGEFVKKFEDVGVPCLESNQEYNNLNAVIKKYDIDIVHKQTRGGDCPDYIRELPSHVKVVETIHCPRASGVPVELLDKIIYTTEYTRMQNDDAHKEIMQSIMYSLDLDKPIREESWGRIEPLVVGRLGRIVMDKRPDMVLEMAKMSWDKYGDKVQFHLAGQIPQDYPSHIKYGGEFKIEVEKLPNVKYMGFVEDKYEFWKTLDICINPVWETSFDIVFLEAMACGIPILTWDNSAAPYVVGKAGIVTNVYRSDFFAGLQKLIEDPDLRAMLGQEGIKMISSIYCRNRMINSYIMMYNEIMESR